MDVLYSQKGLIKTKIHRCLKIPHLFLALNMQSNSFPALTRKISCLKLEINLTIPSQPCAIPYLTGQNTSTYNFGSDCKNAKSSRKELNLRAHRCYVYKLATYT